MHGVLPFSARAFELVFVVYNAVVWPLQPVVHAIGLLMLVCLAAPTRLGDRFVVACLAALWAWTGLVYHIGFFAAINPLAFAFGAAFVVQAALLLDADHRRSLTFARVGAARTLLAWSMLLYSGLFYPLIGIWLGHSYMESPAFGITPCPLTLTTLGTLLLGGRSVPARLFVIPLAWAAVGGSAAALLAMPQDWPLLVFGAGTLLILWRERRRPADSASDAASRRAPRSART